jgi:hypothetical protein
VGGRLSPRRELRERIRQVSGRIYHPSAHTRGHSWIGDERIAVGSLPIGSELDRLPDAGVTHIVNCRARAQTTFSQDLWAERSVFGADRVVEAPMWDHGREQPHAQWAEGATFAARALEDPGAGVLIHCQQGRRRSAMVAYAALRLRGRSEEEAACLVLTGRSVARLVPAYRLSVEEWLESGAPLP